MNLLGENSMGDYGWTCVSNQGLSRISSIGETMTDLAIVSTVQKQSKVGMRVEKEPSVCNWSFLLPAIDSHARSGGMSGTLAEETIHVL